MNSRSNHSAFTEDKPHCKPPPHLSCFSPHPPSGALPARCLRGSGALPSIPRSAGAPARPPAATSPPVAGLQPARVTQPGRPSGGGTRPPAAPPRHGRTRSPAAPPSGEQVLPQKGPRSGECVRPPGSSRSGECVLAPGGPWSGERVRPSPERRTLPSPRRGEGVCPPRRSDSELTGGGATLEPGREARAAAEDQLLREAGRSQRDQEAAECLTPLCHGWLKKNHHNHNKGGSGGGEAAAAGEGAAGEGAAGSGAGGSMRRRGSRGGSMRSVVGFLSQRGLEGDPLLTHDFQRRRLRGCRNLYKKDLLGHFGCVNAIEFSNNGGQWLVSGKANALVPRPLPLPPPQEASSSPAASPAARGREAAAALLRAVCRIHRCPGMMFSQVGI